MKKILIGFLILGFCLSLSAQSFQITSDTDTIGFLPPSINNDDNISLFAKSQPSPMQDFQIYLAHLNKSGIIQNGYKIQTNPIIKILTIPQVFYAESRVISLFFPSFYWSDFDGLGLFSFDYSTGQTWMRGKDFYYEKAYAGFDMDNEKKLFAAFTPVINPTSTHSYDEPNIFETFHLDSIGNTIWKKGYQIIDTTFNSYSLAAKKVVISSEKFLYTLGSFRIYNGTLNDATFILKTDSIGTPLLWKKTNDYDLDQIFIDHVGDIYLLGKTNITFNFTENIENAVIVKLDKDLNEIWTRVFHAEEFEFYRVSMNLRSDGTPYLGYSTGGAFPAILAQLDKDGNIIWEKGYPFLYPELNVMSDGSLLLKTSSHFDANNQIFSKQILCKTDTLGNIDNCETFPTCLQSTLVTTEFGTFQVDTFSIPDLDTLEVFVEPHEFHFSDFCDTPPPPSPEFSYKDTVCVNSCERPFDTHNFFAHGIEWRMEGNGIDSLITDSLDFEYCFEQAGTYTLQQTIWFLGCAYEYEKEIIVTEQFEIEITPDSTMCNDFPAIIEVASNVPVLNYSWNTGGNTASIEVFEIGEYKVSVSDGLCTAVDSILFRNIIEPECFVELSVPNAFTPDGDGVNDRFFPLGEYFELQRILIFNRWGQKVYDGTGADISWDGNCDDQPCVSDVYVYRIQYLNVLSDVVDFLTGNVTLIR